MTHEKKHPWPMEKKIEVVSQYLVLGNMKVVAAVTGVPHDQIRRWKGELWWKELEAEIRQTQNIEMDTKLSKIVDKSLDAVLDRIENGEFFYDQKTGVVKRKPANLRDVARVSVDVLSKRELLRGNVNERKEGTQVSVVEQLKILAAEFAKWQGKPKDTIDVQMVEIVDAKSQGDEESQVAEDGDLSEQVCSGDEQRGLAALDESEQDSGRGVVGT